MKLLTEKIIKKDELAENLARLQGKMVVWTVEAALGFANELNPSQHLTTVKNTDSTQMRKPSKNELCLGIYADLISYNEDAFTIISEVRKMSIKQGVSIILCRAEAILEIPIGVQKTKKQPLTEMRSYSFQLFDHFM